MTCALCVSHERCCHVVVAGTCLLSCSAPFHCTFRVPIPAPIEGTYPRRVCGCMLLVIFIVVSRSAEPQAPTKYLSLSHSLPLCTLTNPLTFRLFAPRVCINSRIVHRFVKLSRTFYIIITMFVCNVPVLYLMWFSLSFCGACGFVIY